MSLNSVVSSPLLLASSSPRRQSLLAELGVAFECFSPDVDETVQAGESPHDYVLRLAKAKAQAGLTHLPDATVIGSDTSVVVDDQILGKPRDYQDFERMMTMLSGRSHQVMTSLAVLKKDRCLAQVVTTDVHFFDISAEQIQRYWQTQEPCDKAGGYGIQGKGAVFVREIEGNYSAVVGLPLAHTAQMLAEFGFTIWS